MGQSSFWLTVVTVVKDDPDGLAKTRASLAKQELTGLEWIVVDSSDDRAVVVDIVDKLEAPTELIWVEPAGVYAAMNVGLRQAAGRYVYFLNAGDQLTDNALREIRELSRETAPDWIVGQVNIEEVSGRTVVTQPFDIGREHAAFFANGRFANHQGTFVSADLLRNIGGFDESYRVAADYKAFLQLMERTPPQQVSDTVAEFVEGGISTDSWFTGWREFARARSEVYSLAGRDLLRERRRSLSNLGVMAWHRSPWPLSGLLIVLMWVFLAATGVGLLDATLVTAAVTLQSIGGALWWRLINRSRRVPILETVAVGIGLGTAVSMLVGLWLPWWLAPGLIGLAWLAVRERDSVSALGRLSRTETLGLLVGLVPGLAAIGYSIRSYPLSWQGVWNGYHGDMPFFEGLAASVAQLGPGASLFMDGADLRYHSLVYGWAGELTWSLDLAPFVVLVRVLPFVALVGCVALAVSWVYRLSSSAIATVLAALLLVSGGFVGATYGTILNFDSPSQSMTTLWLLALSVITLASLKSIRFWPFVAPLAMLGVGLAGGKISTAAIALAGLAALALVGLVRRELWWKRATVALAVSGLATIGVFVTLLVGSSESGGLRIFSLLDRASSLQSLNPVVTPRGIVAGIVVLILAALPRWLGITWLAMDTSRRWSSDVVLGYGFAAGAIATVAVLSGGFNDLWFAVAASAPLAVLSAAGIAEAWKWLGAQGRWRPILATSAGLLIALVVAAMWSTGSSGIIGVGWRWAGPAVGLLLAGLVALGLAWVGASSWTRAWAAAFLLAVVFASLPSRFLYGAIAPWETTFPTSTSPVLSTPRPGSTEWRYISGTSWTSTKNEAGAWLRAQAGRDDVIATNLTGSALVNALTGLQTYISTIHYQAPYGRIAAIDEIKRREDASWDFIADPSRETVRPLCDAGVRWIWVDPSLTEVRDWAPFAPVRFERSDVLILELDSSLCPD